jgi:hypothetical protein
LSWKDSNVYIDGVKISQKGETNFEAKADQAYYLSPGKVKNLFVQKKDSRNVRSVHLETVEISPTMCCFELEGGEEFLNRDELDFLFDLEDFSLKATATILRVDKRVFLNEGYEHKPRASYCAQFDRELDGDFFKRISGTPRVCKSVF